MDGGLPGRQLLSQARGLRGQDLGVDEHSRALEVDEHRHERQLHLAVQGVEPLRGKVLREAVGDLQRQIAPLARELEHRLGRQVGEAARLRPLADDRLVRDGAVADVLERELSEAVRRLRRVEEVAGQQRVEVEPGERRAVPREHEGRSLQVVPHLADRGIAEERRQPRQRRLAIEVAPRPPPSTRCPSGT